MDRLYIPVIILHLSIVAKKHSIATITQLRSLELWTAKSPLPLPWRWHIISIPLTTGRGTGAETCGQDDVFPPDDLCSRPEALCYYIYIYMHFLYECCYRTYIYIQQGCHSVLVKLHPITFYRIVFLGSAQFLGWMPLFCFLALWS